MASNATEPSYAGFTRFELELEFVQCLANPAYINYLATQQLLEDPAFIAYLDYLQYFARPEYVKFLMYPATSLKALELLQQEKLRQDILSPATAEQLAHQSLQASLERLESN